MLLLFIQPLYLPPLWFNLMIFFGESWYLSSSTNIILYFFFFAMSAYLEEILPKLKITHSKQLSNYCLFISICTYIFSLVSFWNKVDQIISSATLVCYFLKISHFMIQKYWVWSIGSSKVLTTVEVHREYMIHPWFIRVTRVLDQSSGDKSMDATTQKLKTVFSLILSAILTDELFKLWVFISKYNRYVLTILGEVRREYMIHLHICQPWQRQMTSENRWSTEGQQNRISLMHVAQILWACHSYYITIEQAIVVDK